MRFCGGLVCVFLWFCGGLKCVCSSEDQELSSARSAERSVLDSDRERDDSSDARHTQRHPAAGRRYCNTDSFQDE